MLASKIKLNVLVSFVYWDEYVEKFITDNRDSTNLLIDSGAFTAWKSGKPIDLDVYCSFLERLGDLPWKYFMLDVIGDPIATMKNYETMLKRGFKPIPIFTRGDDLQNLETFYQTSDVVGLGGLVGTRQNRGYVKWMMNHGIKGRKCHWLGFTNDNFVRYFQPFSCDSSTVVMANKYARVAMYDRRKKKFVVFSKKDFAKKPRQTIIDILQDYEFDALELANNDNWKGVISKGTALSFRSMIRYMLDVKKSFDTNYFIAPIGACSEYIRIAYDAFELERKYHEKNSDDSQRWDGLNDSVISIAR